LRLRVPAWADSTTRILVNGKPRQGDILPGQFFALQRDWRDGDRVEYELGMRTRFEPIDRENPQLLAAMRGPLALVATGTLPAAFSRENLLGARPVSGSSADCEVPGPSGKVLFRPFAAIADEPYRLYQKVQA
jgi:DUF1680 family protein